MKRRKKVYFSLLCSYKHKSKKKQKKKKYAVKIYIFIVIYYRQISVILEIERKNGAREEY